MSVVQRPGDGPEDELSSTEVISGPTVLRILLGGQLRKLREAAGITPDRAGYEIRASRSKISRVEHGRVSFKERDVADLLSLYGVADAEERAALVNLAREANTPGWWHAYSDVLSAWLEPYVGLEAAASVIRTYQIQFVPGLLQTEAYARALIRQGAAASDEEIARRSELRASRQEILRRPDAPQLWVVVDEGALRRPVGSREIVREQLKISRLPTGRQPGDRPRAAEEPGRDGGTPGGDAADPAVRHRSAPSHGRRLHHPQVCRARCRRRGLHRAADQSAVPGKVGRGGQLPGDHEPAVPAGRIGREHRQAAPADSVRHLRA